MIAHARARACVCVRAVNLEQTDGSGGKRATARAKAALPASPRLASPPPPPPLLLSADAMNRRLLGRRDTDLRTVPAPPLFLEIAAAGWAVSSCTGRNVRHAVWHALCSAPPPTGC